MSTNDRQTLEATYVAVATTTRRRCLPPRPRVPVPMSLHQRWRERPRRRARRLTPVRPDGVVHAIVGRVPCPCLRAHSVQENRAARVRVFVRSCEERSGLADSVAVGSRTSLIPRWNRTRSRARIGCSTIARMMLAPCSASSMLSASLRPGQWPGLRALTTPARGTDWQLCDGGRSDEDHNHVDDHVDRAYRGLITSVPHGTPPDRRNGFRSAHSANLERILTTSQPVAGPPRAVDLHTIGRELPGLSRRGVLRTTRRNEVAFTTGATRPG